MVKLAGPGIYSATYSNIPVYEYQFGEALKEHVMRRRGDDWINATHILKAAGFDKPARTRILEREVQKETHEKVQGGYGKYQGTWVPLEQGEALAQRNNVYEKLRPIFEFIPGNLSPPPAPKHTTAKPKVVKRPAVPKFGSSKPVVPPPRVVEEDYDNISAQLNDDESVADDMTVASASFMAEDDRYDISQQSTGHRKRKREDDAEAALQQQHTLWADSLLDYFMLSHDVNPPPKPEPPLNFNPDWLIDSESHTAMHWAAAMGDFEVIRELRKFGANLTAQNIRGETPLMRSVLFTNCLDKQTMPAVVKELIGTIGCRDAYNSTALHHAAAVTESKTKWHCVRYYMDIILNKLQEVSGPDKIQEILDMQDSEGNTALHIAAKHGARKCVRALVGRGASANIQNEAKQTADELIQILNANRRVDRHPQGSSSPFGPDSRSVYEMPLEPRMFSQHHESEAAMSIQSKVTPLIVEKFHDLARSFDDELLEKNRSEEEARRILENVRSEVQAVKEKIGNSALSKETPEEAALSKSQLAHMETMVTSVIEQQQKILIRSRIQREENQSQTQTNGLVTPSTHAYPVTSSSPNNEGGEGDLQERIMLASMLAEQQNIRKQYVKRYTNGQSMAGAGGKEEQYRRLIVQTLGNEAEAMDQNLDVLIEQLREDEGRREGEGGD